MSRRTRLKIHKAGLFLKKNVFNNRYIVRNILALTLVITLFAVAGGAVFVLGGDKQEPAEEEKTASVQVATGSVQEAVVVDGSLVQMNSDSINVLRADFDEAIQAEKQAKENEMVAAAAKDFTDRFVAVAEEVNIREEADAESDIVGKMTRGTCGDVLATEGEWIKIESGEVCGYVRGDLVKTGEDAYAVAKDYYLATATATEDGVCLRAGASKEAEVVGAVYENVTYTVIPEKTTSQWICVKVEGAEGYVSADYMKVSQGYPVATKVEVVETVADEAEQTTESTTEAVGGSVQEVSTQGSVTAQTTQATTQSTTQATTQAPAGNEANIGVTSRTPISLSDADINLMAAVMTLECGGEPYEGQLAVANVILNRLEMGCYGSTMHDVLYAPYQFSVVSDPRLQKLIDNGAQASCIQAAREACSGVNNIGDLYGFKPSWNINTNNVRAYKQIGNHVFFK